MSTRRQPFRATRAPVVLAIAGTSAATAAIGPATVRIFNDSTVTAYVRVGAAATTASHPIAAQGEIDILIDLQAAAVHGITAGTAGNLVISRLE